MWSLGGSLHKSYYEAKHNHQQGSQNVICANIEDGEIDGNNEQLQTFSSRQPLQINVLNTIFESLVPMVHLFVGIIRVTKSVGLQCHKDINDRYWIDQIRVDRQKNNHFSIQ